MLCCAVVSLPVVVSYTMPWYICTRYCIHTYIHLYTTSGSSGIWVYSGIYV
jgi:hypothetical protein